MTQQTCTITSMEVKEATLLEVELPSPKQQEEEYLDTEAAYIQTMQESTTMEVLLKKLQAPPIHQMKLMLTVSLLT